MAMFGDLKKLSDSHDQQPPKKSPVSAPVVPLERLQASKPAVAPPPASEPAPSVRETREAGERAGTTSRSKEVKKYTTKLVNIPSDPAINKVGYYFTRREIDQLDNVHNTLKKIMRDQYGIKIAKHDIIRACLAIGLHDWEEHQLASELVHLLTSK